MKYILNKLDDNIRTTNNFKINDISIDLDLPTTYDFHDFNISNEEIIIKKEIVSNALSSRIGLSFNKYLNVDIIIPKYKKLNDVLIEYNFNNNDCLISNFNIIFEEGSSCDLIFKFKSNDQNKHFNFFKENIISKENSTGSISFINLLNNNSSSFLSIEDNIKNSSNITHNLIDIGGSIRINNIISNIYDRANYYINNLYLGFNEDIIDMNYYLKNIGKNSNSNLVVEGSLNDNSKKNFRGIIDLCEGATKACGFENENCVLLSDTCRSRSLPVLLCHEEDVSGSHGVSTGKIDNDKLFYLMSRGYSLNEALKLIVLSRFYPIINNISIESIRNEILDYLDNLF